MNNKIRKAIFMLTCFLSFNMVAYADGISVSTNKSSTVVGNTVTITVKVSSSSPIVSIEGNLNCSGAGASGGINLKFDDSSNSIYSKTYSYSVKVLNSGTLSCSVSGARMTNMSSASWNDLGSDSASTRVLSQAELEATYSKNNNLASLEVEGHKISPDFNKDTLEYTLELENNVETIKIKGEPADKTATVEGTGDIALQEGKNKIEIKVTAQNGNEKIYIINANVKELDPVNVKINNVKYTVVRKAKSLTRPHDTFVESKTTINGTEVFAYYSEKAKITLVGLKNEKGEISYYSYDEKNKKFLKYNQIVVGGLTLFVLDMDKDIISSGYKKYKLKIGDIALEGYKIKPSSSYYLLYGINILNGKKNIYAYDKNEQTIQIYNQDEIKYYKDINDKYLLGIIVGGGIVGLIIILVAAISIIKSTKNKRKKNVPNNKKNNKNKNKIEEIDI